MTQAMQKPEWLKIRPPKEKFSYVKEVLQKHQLVTVCEEAHCPNISECWSGGTATFMILGDTCTRGCQFCAIKTAKQGQLVDKNEPKNLAKAIKELALFEYIVLTSVDRDDLPDQGAGHFAACIKEIKKEYPEIIIEVLIPDFQGNTDCIQTIIDAGPDVIAHNIETVERLQSTIRDRRASYHQSLFVLSYIKKINKNILTKTSFMVGLGETPEEIEKGMDDLRNHDVDIVTFGQYLKPRNKFLKIKEYVHPDQFLLYEKQAREKGFLYVASGPFVRSSYRAGELFVHHHIKRRTQ